ncbi:MAG: helix-turn-helix domain-containing protein, partial [Bacteroidota bacterium]
GLGIKDFIKEIKLQLAKKYIEEERFETVKELSYALGYKKADYFSALYKDRFGLPSKLSIFKHH